MLGVLAYGSPPTEGSAHWTIPVFPSLDLLVVIPDFPKQGLGVLANLDGGPGKVPESGIIRPTARNGGTFRHTGAPPQRSEHSPWRGDGPRKLSLQSFVSPDTADVRLDKQLFPFGSGAPSEDRRDLGNQGFVIGLSRLWSGKASIGQEFCPLHSAAECFPLVLEQTTQEHPPFRQR